MKHAKRFGVLVVIATLMSSCGIKNMASNEDSEEIRQKYNDLVETYNELSKNAISVHNTTMEQDQNLVTLDVSIQSYVVSLESLDAILARSAGTSTSRTQLLEIEDLSRKAGKDYDLLIDRMGSVESSLLSSLKALKNNIDTNIKEDSRSKARTRVQFSQSLLAMSSNKLTGLRDLVIRTHRASLQKVVDFASATPTHVQTALTANRQTISLNQEEKRISSVQSGSAVTRGSGAGASVLSGRTEILNHARTKGYNLAAAEDAVDMATSTNALMGFAERPTEIAASMEDLLSHIKGRMNVNNEGLELVIALDYSGSMGDDIEAVHDNLQKLSESLRAVQRAGRGVRLAIVTFGQPGREKLELALSSDMGEVQSTLRRLYQNFASSKHSIDPGEASYSGLKLALTTFSSRTENRAVILITDEPSWEVREGRTDIVNHVQKTAKSLGASVLVYPLLVQ